MASDARLRTLLAAACVGASMVLATALAAQTSDRGAPPLPATVGGLETAESLPAWFLASRVHAHTRLAVGPTYGTPAFDNAGAMLDWLGGRVLTRHAKYGDEAPWWPTATYGWTGPGGAPRPDLVSGFLADAEGRGQRTLTYYWHASDGLVEAAHPEWVCKGIDRTTVQRQETRGALLDLTTPYREVVLQRLLELAARGADGFYFDYRHLPPAGCFGTRVEEAFMQATGLPAPTRYRDASYHPYLVFQARAIEETFAYWQAAVQQQHPGVVFVVSTTSVAGLTLPGLSTDLVRLVGSPKTEYDLALRPGLTPGVSNNPTMDTPPADVRMALGWTVLRDAGNGRPPHVWAFTLPDVAHAEGFVASLLTYGAIANIDVAEWHFHDQVNPRALTAATPQAALRAAFRLGNRLSPSLADALPYRWAAIHFSEAARNRRGLDYERAWREVLWPTTGVFGVLARDGVPAGVVTDTQLALGELDGYRVLILPTTDALTPAQQAAVATFEAAGGAVIRDVAAAPWGVPGETADAEAAFRTALSATAGTAPLRVIGGPTLRHAVFYTRPGRLVVAVTNDFTWVQTSVVWPGPIHTPPPPVIGAALEVENRPVPRRVRDEVSGTRLEVEATASGYRVALPTFQTMALLVIDE